MSVKGLRELLAELPFFAGLEPGDLDSIAGCGRTVRFAAGEVLFRAGQPADRFFVLRGGRVAIEIAVPGRGPVTVQTVEGGDVVGWSWLFPPFQWAFDGRALEPTAALAMDGGCLREKCEQEPRLGYELVKRFAGRMVERLQATRVQLLDVYGHGAG